MSRLGVCFRANHSNYNVYIGSLRIETKGKEVVQKPYAVVEMGNVGGLDC